MPMFCELTELAKQLDDVIAKGMSIPDQEDLRKGLSFDPFRPSSVGPDSDIYTPYKWVDNGFMPYEVDHWRQHGKNPNTDSYAEVQKLYDQINFRRSVFKSLAKTVEKDLVKAGAVPIGTVHTYADGRKYKKMGEGDWQLVSDPRGVAKKEDPKAKMGAKKEQPSGKGQAEDKETGARDKEIQAQKIRDAIKDKKVEDRKGKEAIRKETGSFQADTSSSFDADEDDSTVETAPADKGLPDNDMGPPPAEYSAFVKPGEKLELEEVESFIQKFEADFKALTSMNSLLKNAGATHFSSRLKDRLSLFNKMKGRLKDRSLNTVTDVIGARGLAGSIEDQKKMLEQIEKEVELVEVSDSTEKGRKDGYRAIHVLFRTPSGKIGELQLKTHLQQIFAGFTHDSIYKGPPEIKNSPEVNQYTVALSKYLNDIDNGVTDIERNRPVEPQILKDAGLMFPWDELDEFGQDKIATKEGPVKYYAVVRDEKKRNIGIEEFNSFKEAKKFQQDKYKEGHKGEVPLAYAQNKEEFLQVFSEYRPVEMVSKELQEKVRRREKGKGEEVDLTSAELRVLLDEGKFSFVSAGRNPANEEDMKLSDEQITERYNKLRNDLQDMGYVFTKVTGHYGGEEDSFLVMAHDAEKEDMVKLGEKYNQDSVIYADKGRQEMHYTVGKNKGQHQKGEGWQETPDAEDFYSVIKTSDGKEVKFALNFKDELEKALKLVLRLMKSKGMI
jgi:ppGpp synthetase/RelA/SpoT-type nucleotidyltranferase